MDIKNIIFDLGGVVIDIRRENAAAALEALGIADAPALLGEYEQKGPFLLLETGAMTAAQVFDHILPLCRPGTSCSEIQDAFERFLIEIPLVRLQAIRRLREAGFRTFVLSNTNPVMFNHWIGNAFRQEGLSINDYFDGIVVSFQEGICKPDPQIFKNLTKRYGLDPEETLMLDDSEANCESARSTGLHAIRITGEGDDTLTAVADKLINERKSES